MSCRSVCFPKIYIFGESLIFFWFLTFFCVFSCYSTQASDCRWSEWHNNTIIYKVNFGRLCVSRGSAVAAMLKRSPFVQIALKRWSKWKSCINEPLGGSLVACMQFFVGVIAKTATSRWSVYLPCEELKISVVFKQASCQVTTPSKVRNMRQYAH